jgi:oligoendopeptidase F
LLQIYKKDPNRAVELYKKGASTDLSESIAQVYHDTEVEFDFSSQTLETIATFVERLIEELL